MKDSVAKLLQLIVSVVLSTNGCHGECNVCWGRDRLDGAALCTMCVSTEHTQTSWLLWWEKSRELILLKSGTMSGYISGPVPVPDSSGTSMLIQVRLGFALRDCQSCQMWQPVCQLGMSAAMHMEIPGTGGDCSLQTQPPSVLLWRLQGRNVVC